MQPIARRSLRAKYDDALAMCRKAIELAPHYPPARWFMGLVYQQRKEHRPAIAACQNAVRYSRIGSLQVAPFGNAYGTAGEALEPPDRRMARRSGQRHMSKTSPSHAPAGYSSRVAISVAQPVSMRLLLASKCSTSALAANLVPA